MQPLITNARALAVGTVANLNIDALEENNITYWEVQCDNACAAAKAAHAAGDLTEGRTQADWMRHARRMADAGIARRLGR